MVAPQILILVVLVQIQFPLPSEESWGNGKSQEIANLSKSL